MTIVSLVHTKGGVGKTTSAVFLAAAAHRRGIDVELIDADPQGSALDWAATADEGTLPLGVPSLPFPITPAGRPLTTNPARQLTIIDTPPGAAAAIAEAIEMADLVVVPTGASPLDVRRVWPTLEITAHRPTAVLMTGVDMRTRLADEVRALLNAEGVPVIGTPIVRREAIRRAYGSAPDRLHGYDDVLTELLGALVHV
jgi:chromosome partitioning protein